MTNWRNLGLDNMQNTLLGNQSKINFYCLHYSCQQPRYGSTCWLKTRCCHPVLLCQHQSAFTGSRHWTLHATLGVSGKVFVVSSKREKINVCTYLVLPCMTTVFEGFVLVFKKSQETKGNNSGCSIVVDEKVSVDRLFYLIGNRIQVYLIPMKWMRRKLLTTVYRFKFR